MAFNVEFFGVDELNFLFSEFKMRPSNTNRMLNRAVNTFYSIMEETFASNGRHHQWKALTKKYAKSKDKAGYGNLPILQRTQELKDSLTGSSDIIITKDENSVNISLPHNLSGRFYGHQFGASKHGGFPKRIIVDFTEKDQQRILKAMINATPLSRYMTFLGGN